MTAIEAIEVALIELRRKLKNAVGATSRERIAGEIDGLRKAKALIIEERNGLS